ncbi:hypothetical protein KY284_029980 [Solanum tuberosum]|nr:hypothetical protein KY284_029980 [Solanum tuberosum]
MLRRYLRQERRKGLDRDHLMARKRKTIKVIFTCVAPGNEIPQLNPKDFTQFPMLNEAWASLIPPEDLDSDIDTT